MKILTSLLFLIISSYAFGTLTPLFWTNCTTDILETGLIRFNQNDFFTLFNRRSHGQIFNPDVGVSYGLFTWNKLSCEVGIDYLGGADDPLYFNGKVGFEENVLFNEAPAFNIGVCGWGTKIHGKNRTTFNTLMLIFGKSLPDWLGGRVFFCGYSGGSVIGKNRQGFMVGMDYFLCPAVYCDGTHYHQWIFAADYASGKNYVGGGGAGLTYYFTPDISLQFGPVFFNDATLNGTWKWTFQFTAILPH